MRGLLKPRIIRIVNSIAGKRRPPTLLDYKNRDELYGFHERAGAVGGAISRVLSDHEIKVLLLWAIISPSAALAYLIWIKYPVFRAIAILLFAVSIVQFVGQWGGVYWVLQKMGVVP